MASKQIQEARRAQYPNLIAQVDGHSHIWTSMFEPPENYNDVYEYTLIRHEESQSQGNLPITTQPKFVFINKELNAYWHYHAGYIRILGAWERVTPTDAGAGRWFPANSCAMANLGQFALFSKADLYINKIPVETNNNPALVALVNCLTRFSENYAQTTATNFFYYKDTDNPQGTGVVKYVSTFTYNTGTPANSTVTTALNATYNEGFAKRAALTCAGNDNLTKKQMELLLPLSWLFGFFDAVEYPLVGTDVRIELTKNQNFAEAFHGSTADAAKFVFDEIHMVVPRVLPSTEVEAEIMNKIKDKFTREIKFYEYSVEVDEDRDIDTAKNKAKVWKVNTVDKKITRAFKFDMIKAHREDFNANPMVMVHNNVRKLKAKLGTINVPYDDYTPKFGNATDSSEQYAREIYELANITDMNFDEQGGNQINRTNFKNIYPILALDFRSIPESVFLTQQVNDITIEEERDNVDAVGVYNSYLVIESERSIILDSAMSGDNARLIVKQ